MKHSSEVDFLASKLELLCAAIPDEPTRANARILFGGPIAAWTKGPAPARSRLVKLERTMEQMSASMMNASSRMKIDEELNRSYGYSSLGETPVAIVNQALNRGTISTETEAEVIRVFINNLGNETLVGSRKFRKLAQLMIVYGD